MVQEGAPTQDLYGKLYRSRINSPNVEIWLVEDTNFLTKMTSRLETRVAGSWKNVWKALQMPINGSWWCYTLREALGEPGHAGETTMNAFHWHLENGTLRKNDNESLILAIFDRRLRGPHWTHSNLPSSGGPLDGLLTFLNQLWHCFTVLPGLGSLMEIGQHSTMWRARMELWTDSETQDANAGVSLYGMAKLGLDAGIFMFKVCVYVAF